MTQSRPNFGPHGSRSAPQAALAALTPPKDGRTPAFDAGVGLDPLPFFLPAYHGMNTFFPNKAI